MSELIKSLYNSLEEPVVVYDTKSDTYHCNKVFSHVFGDTRIQKIVNKFHFDIGLLESEEVKTYTPISAALSSKYDFCSFANFQKDRHVFLNFIIKAIHVRHFKIIYFYDITDKVRLERLEAENEALKIQNQQFASTHSIAQNQAVKMGLLNRISTSILETKDIKDLINTALKELGIMFGATKVYFAQNNAIEYIFPQNLTGLGERVVFDTSVQELLSQGQVSISTVLKEHQESQEHLKSPMTRIVVPICTTDVPDSFMGFVVVLTSKKEIAQAERELLTSIRVQITNALLKMQLFEKIHYQKEVLENALTELKEMQLQLINSEKMASLGQLIASVAHEINTPLASISANNEMRQKLDSLSEEGKEPDFELRRELSEIDTEAIKRISNLVQSLKRFVRLDEEVQQQADINSELDLTLNILRHKTKNGIEIVKNYGEIPFVNCYPNMLNQVFLNLLMNSIQANACRITITTSQDNENIYISIKDNGCGICDEGAKKIFQAGYTTKKVGEGTGLGLAICKKIVEKHQGDLSFLSKEGVTEFLVKIPV